MLVKKIYRLIKVGLGFNDEPIPKKEKVEGLITQVRKIGGSNYDKENKLLESNNNKIRKGIKE